MASSLVIGKSSPLGGSLAGRCGSGQSMTGASRGWPSLLPDPMSLAEVVLQAGHIGCGVLVVH